MRTIAIALGVGLVTLCGCQQKDAQETGQSGPDPVILHQAMKDIVAPQAQVLWDITNNAMNNNGDIDPALLKPADWARIADAGAQLKAKAHALAAATQITVAAPGEKIQDQESPGGSSAADVKRFIDADRQGFSDMAGTLASSADEFVAAARARDTARLAVPVQGLDEVCEACHVKYWYPQQVSQKK